jgi:hypothetical protein
MGLLRAKDNEMKIRADRARVIIFSLFLVL